MQNILKLIFICFPLFSIAQNIELKPISTFELQLKNTDLDKILLALKDGKLVKYQMNFAN